MIFFQSWDWDWIVQKHCITSISTWYTIDRVVRKRSNGIVYWKPRLNWESGVSINCFWDRFKLCSFVLSMIILLKKFTNPPKLLFILSLLVKVFDACVSNLTYLKHFPAYQYSLFNIQWTTPCLFIVFDQCSFFYVSTLSIE